MAVKMYFDPTLGLYLGPDAVGHKEFNETITNLLKAVVVETITERDALVSPKLFVLVLDATEDPTVTNGAAMYLGTFDATETRVWVKVMESESMDLVLQWANIQGRPISSPTQIDAHLNDISLHAGSRFEFLDTLVTSSNRLVLSGTGTDVDQEAYEFVEGEWLIAVADEVYAIAYNTTSNQWEISLITAPESPVVLYTGAAPNDTNLDTVTDWIKVEDSSPITLTITILPILDPITFVPNTTYIITAPCIGRLPITTLDKTWVKVAVKQTGDGTVVECASATDTLEDSVATIMNNTVATQTFIYKASEKMWYII